MRLINTCVCTIDHILLTLVITDNPCPQFNRDTIKMSMDVNERRYSHGTGRQIFPSVSYTGRMFLKRHDRRVIRFQHICTGTVHTGTISTYCMYCLSSYTHTLILTQVRFFFLTYIFSLSGSHKHIKVPVWRQVSVQHVARYSIVA